MAIKPGDIVGRKSYGCDVLFKVCDIEENRNEEKTVLLKGINVRLLADSPEADLVLMSEEEVEKIAAFLASLDKNIPLHLTRYFPNYKIHRPPTDIDVMLKAREVASKYLNNVHLGNV